MRIEVTKLDSDGLYIVGIPDSNPRDLRLLRELIQEIYRENRPKVILFNRSIEVRKIKEIDKERVFNMFLDIKKEMEKGSIQVVE